MSHHCGLSPFCFRRSQFFLLLTGMGMGCLILQVLTIQNNQTLLEEVVQRLEENQRANQAFVGYYPQQQMNSPLNMMQNQRDEASIMEYSGDSTTRAAGEKDGASSSLRSEEDAGSVGASTDGRAVEKGGGDISKEKDVRNYRLMQSNEALKEVKQERSGLCISASLSIGSMENFTPNYASASLGILKNIALRSILSQKLPASIKMSEIDISLSDWEHHFESREALETFFNVPSLSHHTLTFNGINRTKFDSSVGCKWYARVRLDADDALGEGFYEHLADVVIDQILQPSKGLWLGALVAFSCVERLQMAMGRCLMTTNSCTNPSRHTPQGYSIGQTRLIRYDLYETHYDTLRNGGLHHLAVETLRNQIMPIMNITDYKSELYAHKGNESYAAYDELKSRVKLINLFNNPDRRLTPFYFQTALSWTFPWHSVANFPECTKEQQQRILHERNLSSGYEFLFEPDFTRNVTMMDSCKSNHYFIQGQSQLMQKYGTCDNMTKADSNVEASTNQTKGKTIYDTVETGTNNTPKLEVYNNKIFAAGNKAEEKKVPAQPVATRTNNATSLIQEIPVPAVVSQTKLEVHCRRGFYCNTTNCNSFSLVNEGYTTRSYGDIERSFFGGGRRKISMQYWGDSIQNTMECDMRQWVHAHRNSTVDIAVKYVQVGCPWRKCTPDGGWKNLPLVASEATVIVFNIGAHYESRGSDVFEFDLNRYFNVLDAFLAEEDRIALVRGPSATHFDIEDGLLPNSDQQQILVESWKRNSMQYACVPLKRIPTIVQSQAEGLKNLVLRLKRSNNKAVSSRVEYLDVYKMSRERFLEHTNDGRAFDCKHFCQNCGMLRAWNTLVVDYLTTEKGLKNDDNRIFASGNTTALHQKAKEEKMQTESAAMGNNSN